jgi:hypothetical protein
MHCRFDLPQDGSTNTMNKLARLTNKAIAATLEGRGYLGYTSTLVPSIDIPFYGWRV